MQAPLRLPFKTDCNTQFSCACFPGWYYRTESNRLLPVSNRGSAFELQQHMCYALIGHCFIALLYILFLSASLKCVAYGYISIYERVAIFSGTPGGVRPTKNRASAGKHPAPRAPAHRPAARRRPYWNMDKTELSVIRKQTSRAEPANPHSFVGRMSHNKSCTTFPVKVSATDGLTAIYHKFINLSSDPP